MATRDEGGSTPGPSQPLADMGRDLLQLADSLRDGGVDELTDRIGHLAQHNPAVLMVGSLTLGFNLCRSEGSRPSRYLNERLHDWGHSPAAHAAASDEDADYGLSSDEPTEAPGRLGDLRHQGERLHDKASDVGQGDIPPEQPPRPEPRDSAAFYGNRLRLQAAQPLLLGALGIAAGALLAALLPDRDTNPPNP